MGGINHHGSDTSSAIQVVDLSFNPQMDLPFGNQRWRALIYDEQLGWLYTNQKFFLIFIKTPLTIGSMISPIPIAESLGLIHILFHLPELKQFV